MTFAPLAFRVQGGADCPRRIVDAHKAWSLYAVADPRVQPELPAFLSAFTFPRAIKQHLDATGSTAGYAGPVGVPFVHFDLDRIDLDDAVRDARRLSAFLVDRYHLDGEDLVVAFSGSKGFHISIPMPPMEPTPDHHAVAKALACRLAGAVNVAIDEGIYGKVGLLRAPNSRHGKTGLFKVRIDADELLHLDADQVLHRAVEPIPFDVPAPAASSRLVEDWNAAADEVRRRADRVRQEVATRSGRSRSTLNPTTLDLIRDPTSIEAGHRHRTIFSAAADLAEFGTVEDLVVALLTEPGLDTGLPPREVIRQIQTGIAHARHTHEGDAE